MRGEFLSLAELKKEGTQVGATLRGVLLLIKSLGRDAVAPLPILASVPTCPLIIPRVHFIKNRYGDGCTLRRS